MGRGTESVHLDAAAAKKPEAPELRPVDLRWDMENNRVTLIQRQHELAIHPVEITITFDSLELMFFMLFQAALSARGVLPQAQAPSPIQRAH